MKKALFAIALVGVGFVMGSAVGSVVMAIGTGIHYHKAMLGNERSREVMNKLNFIGKEFIYWKGIY